MRVVETLLNFLCELSFIGQQIITYHHEQEIVQIITLTKLTNLTDLHPNCIKI